MVSNARLDLPEPESPVITVRLSRAMSTLMPLRLCSRAPRTDIWVSIGSASFRLCSRLAWRAAPGQRGTEWIWALPLKLPELEFLTAELRGSCTAQLQSGFLHVAS